VNFSNGKKGRTRTKIAQMHCILFIESYYIPILCYNTSLNISLNNFGIGIDSLKKKQ